MNILNIALLGFQVVRYNLKIVFGNKFIYFLIAATAFFLMVIGFMLFSDSNPSDYDIYGTLIFPGILIIFYPVIVIVEI